MGIVFPFFASIFTEYKSSVYQIPFMISCVVAGCIVGVISFFIGKITLINAIRRFFKTFESISEGDLTVRCNMKSNDELGRLSDEFNEFLEKIQDIFKTNQQLAKTVNELSKSLKDDAFISEDVSNGIVTGTVALADGASVQNDQLLLVKERMELISIQVDAGYERANRMMDTSNNAVKIAKEGSEEMKEVV